MRICEIEYETSDIWELQEEECRQELLKRPWLFENTVEYKSIIDFLNSFKNEIVIGQEYIYSSIFFIVGSLINVASFDAPKKLVAIENNQTYFEIDGKIKQYPYNESIEGDLLKVVILFESILQLDEFKTMLTLKFGERSIKFKNI